jgi:hypothetical protein
MLPQEVDAVRRPTPALILRTIAQAVRLEGWLHRRCERPSFATRALTSGRRLTSRMMSESLDTISSAKSIRLGHTSVDLEALARDALAFI